MTTPSNLDKPIQGKELALVSLSLSLATFMNVLDISITNVAIPPITSDLGVSPYQGAWIITSFGTSMGIMVPLTAWLSSRFGTVRLFTLATAAFTLASLLCGLSANFIMLILFRVFQGAAAGIMLPLSQSLLLMSYSKEKRGTATALFTMTAVLGPILGPVLGGWIADNWYWPWIFYINLPVGIFSSYVTWYILRHHETPIIKNPIDKVGLFLLVVGVSCLQMFLDKGDELDWFDSNIVVGLAVIAAVALSCLVVWELTDPYPIIDLRLFKRRNFFLGTITFSIGFSLIIGGSILIFPLWLQTQLNYTPTWAGLATAFLGVLTLIVAPLVGFLVNKVDLRIIAVISFIVFGLTSLWSGMFNMDANFGALVMPRLVQGIGFGCFFIPILLIVLSGIPKDQITSALGLATFFRLIGGSFGASLSVALWKHREAFHHTRLTENINELNPNYTEMLHKMQVLGFDKTASLEQMNNMITQQAFMLSTNDYFLLSGIIYLVLIFFICFAKPPFAQDVD